MRLFARGLCQKDNTLWESFKAKSFISERIGTFILVLFGCGAAVLIGEQIGMLGIASAFGLAIVAAAYGLGQNGFGPGYLGEYSVMSP